MDITRIINSFQQFLNISWAGLPAWIKDEEKSWHAIDDWYQTNWETLVETEINQIIDRQKLQIGLVTLEIFGNGADCNGASSRVFQPKALPTHFIKVNNLYRFDSLGKKFDNDWFKITYPFDYARVLDSEDNEIIMRTDGLVFELAKIT